MMDSRFLWVHRDVGDGFTHFDSPDCGCRPYRVYCDDDRSLSEIMSTNGDYDGMSTNGDKSEKDN